MAGPATEKIRTGTDERPALGSKAPAPTPSRPLALIAAVGVLLAAAAGGGGYLAGNSTGEDLDAARKAGTQAGQKAGAATGDKAGYEAGFNKARDAAYAAAYEKAYRAGYRTSYTDAGQDPPAAGEIPVPSQ
jgi:hypothetical protein